MLDQVAMVITIAGALVAILPKLVMRRIAAPKPRSPTTTKQRSGQMVFRTLSGSSSSVSNRARDASRTSGWVLAVFATIAVIFAIAAAWRYWPQVIALGDTFFFAGALLLVMVAGMFVQVLSSNFNHDRPLLAITPSELLYPLLFSPIVFYPIWIVGNHQGAQVFSFYAAFLNGYFWQSVVAAAKRPQALAPVSAAEGASKHPPAVPPTELH